MFSCFDTIHERDGQTDGQTLHDGKDHAMHSSRAVKTADKMTANNVSREKVKPMVISHGAHPVFL